MKNLCLVLAFLASITYVSAQKYISKTGHIGFFSHTPMEDIEAHNNQVFSTLDVATGEIKFTLLIKSFVFKRALMQEHFNENYMESDKLPKASFVGKITNLTKIDFNKDGSYKAEIAGDMTIHGVSRPFTTTGTIDIKGGVVSAKASFPIVPKDYDIKIPSLVESKIAKQMETSVDLTYSPYK